MTLDPHRCRMLACEVVLQGVETLKAQHHPREIAFFTDASKSELWCVAAGLDWEATVSRLRHDGHLEPAPPKAPKAPPAPKPQRSTYQIEMERRVLAKLPLYPATACSARRMADAVGVYVAVVRTALNGLKSRGLAESRTVPLRGGMTNIWWRISTKPD